MKKLYRLIYLISLLFTVVYYLPTVNYYVPESIIYFTLPFILLLISSDIIRNKAMLFFFLFMCFVVTDQFINERPILNDFTTTISYLSMFNWAALAIYFTKRKKEYFILVKIGILCMLITVIVSLFWTIISPSLIRDSVREENQALLVAYSKLGLMNYGFAHALPLVFPFLIIIAKKEVKKNKIILYGFLLISILLLFQASITTSFFLGVVISTIAFFFRGQNLRQLYIRLAFVGTILFFWGDKIAISTLELIQPVFAGSLMEPKIYDLILSFNSNELEGQEVIVRAEKQELSWNTFSSNLLTGSKDVEMNGGHSFFADYLAYFGIIGFMPFLIFIYFHSKYFISRINAELRPYFILSLFYFVAISFAKGRALLEMYSTLLFFVPGLALYASYTYFRNNDERKLNSN